MTAKQVWRLCLQIGTAIFVLFLMIHYWDRFTRFFATFMAAMWPLWLGLAIAYGINILMHFYEQHYFPHSSRRAILRSRRPVSLLAAIVSVLLILALLLSLIIPELIRSVQTLVNLLPQAVQELSRFAESTPWLQLPFIEQLQHLNWQQTLQQISGFLSRGVGGTFTAAAGFFASFLNSTVNVVLGIIFAIYLLLAKDRLLQQLQRLVQSYLNPAWQPKIRHLFSTFNDCLHRYIVGQCLEAVIIGVLCALGLWIFRFPYASMIGVVVGFTALIPIVGAFLGGAIGFFLLLTVSPIKALLFLVYLLILQQLENNLIYPKVVGSSLGLPGLWVLAAVTVGGGAFGLPGMLLGVPITACLYRLLREDLHRREDQKTPAPSPFRHMRDEEEPSPFILTAAQSLRQVLNKRKKPDLKEVNTPSDKESPKKD